MRRWALYAVLAAALVATFWLSSVFLNQQKNGQWTYSDLVRNAKSGQVKQVDINGTQGTATDKKGAMYDVTLPDQTASLADTLSSQGVNVRYTGTGGASSWLGTLLPNLLIFALIGGLFYLSYRGTQRGGAGQAMSFGRSRARVLTGTPPDVRFTDVAGADEAVQELRDVVDFLSHPEKFARAGANIPKGALLVGPPGTGKTLLARAVAGEAHVPFFNLSGSEFVEMFVGVGASRVRDLFEQAKKSAPCIVFVDEIDAVGRQRGAGLGGGNDEREQTLNQLLVEMDGFDTATHVIVLAATNRPDVLDPALLRPGRFDRRVTIDRPDVQGRRAILDVHVRRKWLDGRVDLDVVARQTPGFCGADLANLVNEAAILTARAGRAEIEMPDLEEAASRVIAGPERRSLRISDREKEIIAYHEAGHALVMRSLPNGDRVHRVSIVSRGSALGFTMSLPEEDVHIVSDVTLREQIAGAMGGRVAEELVFTSVTSGAENDIDRATRLARRMVTRWGMSDRVGAVAMGENEDLVFLGRDLGERRNYSEEAAAVIDEEVHRIVDVGQETARRILSEQLHALHGLAHRLIEVETIDADDLDQLLTGLGAPLRGAASA
jgi:cell division protease FtsH